MFETQACWGGVNDAAIFFVFFPVTVKQEDVCGSNLGVTVSSVQSTETTVSAAHRQSKLSEQTGNCVCAWGPCHTSI